VLKNSENDHLTKIAHLKQRRFIISQTLGVHLNSSYLRTLRNCVLEWTNQEPRNKSTLKHASTRHSCRVESKYPMQI